MTVPESAMTAAPSTEADIDPDRWPDVARLPGRPVRGAIAERLFRLAVDGLPLRIELVPTGEPLGRGVEGDPVMRVVRPDAVFDRIGDSGLIGFGEAYMAGDWEAGAAGSTCPGDDLVDVMAVFANHTAELFPPWLARLRRLGVRRRPAAETNTPQGSRRNIARHYDLSNDHFAGFLDPSMTYSAALFPTADGHLPRSTFDQLQAAQHAKIDRLLDLCAVGPGSTLLEIGTGWGGLAIRAAQRGAIVRTITLSVEQQRLARARVAAAGLGDRVSVELCDYRSVEGRYDAVISVEMIEAVGEAYWSTYLSVIDDVLAPGGTAALQAITIPHERMVATRNDQTWIHKYVFPGGKIPSVEAISAAALSTDLEVVGDLAFGLHYAETLRLWRERFEAGSTHDELGSDPTFRRMWTFYLAYSEAGFRAGYLDVHHLVLRRP
jgi:cyclopropane-fatty-acyl-phospholipid synthase